MRTSAVYRLLVTVTLCFLLVSVAGAEKPKPSRTPQPTATPANRLKILKDFQVELFYSVPKETEGSWVKMCTDPDLVAYVLSRGDRNNKMFK